MYNKLKFTVFLFVFLGIFNACSQAAETPVQQELEVAQPQSEALVSEAVKAENSFIQTKPEEKAIELPKEQEVQKLKIEEVSVDKLPKQPDVVKVQVEENIFNRKFEKKFDSGLFKSIELVGAQDLIFTRLKAGVGPGHSVFDNETGVYGVKGYFRDGTFYNFTMAPFLDVPGYSTAGCHRLFEYYLRKDIGKHHNITIGQQRTPVGIEGSASSFGLAVGRRSQMGGKYGNFTAIGAKVAGNYDRVEYQLGVFDTGRFLKNNFETPPEFAGLVSFKPIKDTKKYGKLKVGGSYNTGKLDYSYNVYGLHALYDYKKFHNITEVAYANGYNGRTNSGAKSSGFNTTFLYDVHPKIQAFTRFDAFDANRSLSGQKSNEYTVGLHYYLKGKKARFTLSYIFCDNESRPDSNRLFTNLELLL